MGEPFVLVAIGPGHNQNVLSAPFDTSVWVGDYGLSIETPWQSVKLTVESGKVSFFQVLVKKDGQPVYLCQVPLLYLEKQPCQSVHATLPLAVYDVSHFSAKFGVMTPDFTAFQPCSSMKVASCSVVCLVSYFPASEDGSETILHDFVSKAIAVQSCPPPQRPSGVILDSGAPSLLRNFGTTLAVIAEAEEEWQETSGTLSPSRAGQSLMASPAALRGGVSQQGASPSGVVLSPKRSGANSLAPTPNHANLYTSTSTPHSYSVAGTLHAEAVTPPIPIPAEPIEEGEEEEIHLHGFAQRSGLQRKSFGSSSRPGSAAAANVTPANELRESTPKAAIPLEPLNRPGVAPETARDEGDFDGFDDPPASSRVDGLSSQFDDFGFPVSTKPEEKKTTLTPSSVAALVPGIPLPAPQRLPATGASLLEHSSARPPSSSPSPAAPRLNANSHLNQSNQSVDSYAVYMTASAPQATSSFSSVSRPPTDTDSRGGDGVSPVRSAVSGTSLTPNKTLLPPRPTPSSTASPLVTSPHHKLKPSTSYAAAPSPGSVSLPVSPSATPASPHAVPLSPYSTNPHLQVSSNSDIFSTPPNSWPKELWETLRRKLRASQTNEANVSILKDKLARERSKAQQQASIAEELRLSADALKKSHIHEINALHAAVQAESLRCEALEDHLSAQRIENLSLRTQNEELAAQVEDLQTKLRFNEGAKGRDDVVSEMISKFESMEFQLSNQFGERQRLQEIHAHEVSQLHQARNEAIHRASSLESEVALLKSQISTLAALLPARLAAAAGLALSSPPPLHQLQDLRPMPEEDDELERTVELQGESLSAAASVVSHPQQPAAGASRVTPKRKVLSRSGSTSSMQPRAAPSDGTGLPRLPEEDAPLSTSSASLPVPRRAPAATVASSPAQPKPKASTRLKPALSAEDFVDPPGYTVGDPAQNKPPSRGTSPATRAMRRSNSGTTLSSVQAAGQGGPLRGPVGDAGSPSKQGRALGFGSRSNRSFSSQVDDPL